MSYIPHEIFRQILLRVPAVPLLRFRAVCKAWCSVIDDESFIKTYTNERAPTTLLIRNSRDNWIFSVPLDCLSVADGSQIIKATPVRTLFGRGVRTLPYLPVAYCKGLILISQYSNAKEIWVIWNPATREFHELPEFDTGFFTAGIGLGYDSVTDDYKVVVIGGNNNSTLISWRSFVYTRKFGSWKMIKDDFPSNIRYWYGGCGVFLNDSLYWNADDMIVVFNLGTEDYSQLPRPRVTNESDMPFGANLDAIGGCLVFSCRYFEHNSGKDRLDGWVMEDCEVEKSWSKLFSFSNFRDRLPKNGIFKPRDCFCPAFRPIAYLRSRGQILLHHGRTLFWLDIEKNSAKKVTIHGLPDNFINFYCRICPESLFRLDKKYSVLTTRAQSKMASKRLKISVKPVDGPESDSSWMSVDAD